MLTVDEKMIKGESDLLCLFKLSVEIQKRKSERLCVRIEKTDGYVYYLRDVQNKKYVLKIGFVGVDILPVEGDMLYLFGNIIDSMKENLFSYTFSTKIGETCAREPHNFLKNPEEFLILEYNDGKTILLE